MRDVAAITRGLTQPAVQVFMDAESSRSHFGGSTNLPAGESWRQRNGQRLTFLVRISLPEVHGAVAFDWLPRDVALLFFYDMEEQPWGSDPADRGAWAVLHVPDLVDTAASAGSGDESGLRFRTIGLRHIDSFPSPWRDEIARLDLSDDESDRYAEVCDGPFEDGLRHQIGGFPTPVQGEQMGLECQLASHGVARGASADPREQSLRPGAGDWRLLFQYEPDDELDVMWGDSGTLYFWVRQRAARAGNFRDTWLILQCC